MPKNTEKIRRQIFANFKFDPNQTMVALGKKFGITHKTASILVSKGLKEKW